LPFEITSRKDLFAEYFAYSETHALNDDVQDSEVKALALSRNIIVALVYLRFGCTNLDFRCRDALRVSIEMDFGWRRDSWWIRDNSKSVARYQIAAAHLRAKRSVHLNGY